MKARLIKGIIATMLTAFLCAVLVLNLYFPLKYKSEIAEASQEFDVDSRLIYSVIWTESKFDKYAVSKAGACGLMQLMPSTAIWCADKLNLSLSEGDIYNPRTNIRLGTYYLSYLLDKFSDLDKALAAYNAGEGNVSKWEDGIPFKETRDYVRRVSLAKKIYTFKLK